MLTVKIDKPNTPGITVHRATLMAHGEPILINNKPLFSYTCKGDANDAVTGLILDIGRFKTEAIAAISKHLREAKK